MKKQIADSKYTNPIPLVRPWFDNSEPEAVTEVIRSGWLISGNNVKQFETDFARIHDAKYGIAVNSGSSALLVSLGSLGLKSEDEVIVPDMTFISTATASMFLGCKPVFCDIDPYYHNLNPDDLEKRITKKTKLIIPVHYAGQSAPMDRINEIAETYNIQVLEDAAEAHMTMYNSKYVGTFGVAGIFSFTPSKLITTGEGGMILTNDKVFAERCFLFRNFGDTSKFHWDHLGFNFRMPEIMGALGLCQLKKLTQAIAKRRNIAIRYNNGFKDCSAIIIPHYKDYNQCNFQLYTIQLDLKQLLISRDAFINLLAKNNISSRLYYPPLHRQKIFSCFGQYSDRDYPNTCRFSESALSLPIFPELSDLEQEYIIETILKIISLNKR